MLPARFPNLLVNGAGGIAVGMATNIPPHNLGEVIAACKAYMDDPAITIEELIEIVPGPDFPTAPIILGQAGARSAYHTGRGSILMRARHKIEEGRGDRRSIVLTSIPYQVGKNGLVEKIAEAAKDKRDRGHLRHSRRIEPRGRARRHRPQARRHPRRRPQPALAAHPGPVELPGQHAGDPRRPARDADPARHHRELRPLPRGGDHPARQVRARQGARPRPYLARPGHRRHQSRRGGADHPRLRLAGRGPRGADRARLADRRDRALHRARRGGRGRGRRGDSYRLSEAQVRAILELRLHRLTALGRDEIAGELREARHLDRRTARDPRRPGQALRGDARRVRRDRAQLMRRRASPRSRRPGTGSRTRI